MLPEVYAAKGCDRLRWNSRSLKKERDIRPELPEYQKTQGGNKNCPRLL